MKRRLLFLAFVLSTVVGWSQTVMLKFKNGTTQQYNMSELESIDFKDGDNNNSGNDDAEVEITKANLVGVWELASYDIQYTQGYGLEVTPLFQQGDKLSILSDGTCFYHRKNDIYMWYTNGKQITISTADPKDATLPGVFWILKLTSEELLLYLNYGSFNITYSYKRVS